MKFSFAQLFAHSILNFFARKINTDIQPTFVFRIATTTQTCEFCNCLINTETSNRWKCAKNEINKYCRSRWMHRKVFYGKTYIALQSQLYFAVYFSFAFCDHWTEFPILVLTLWLPNRAKWRLVCRGTWVQRHWPPVPRR